MPVDRRGTPPEDVVAAPASRHRFQAPKGSGKSSQRRKMMPSSAAFGLADGAGLDRVGNFAQIFQRSYFLARFAQRVASGSMYLVLALQAGTGQPPRRAAEPRPGQASHQFDQAKEFQGRGRGVWDIATSLARVCCKQGKAECGFSTPSWRQSPSPVGQQPD